MKKFELKNRKGQKIVGVLKVPLGGVKGTCVIQHGWGSHKNKRVPKALEETFAEEGFQTFNFDATNSFGESDGDYEKSTLGTFWEDFEDVTNWVQLQDWFKLPLLVSGHSKGGYSATRYAEEYPEKVGYLVAVAPIVSGKLSFETHEKRDPGSLDRWKNQEVIEKIDSEGNLKRNHWYQMEERLNHDLLLKVERLTMPTVLIVGDEDDSCFDQTKILFQEMPKKKASIKILEGLPHSYRTSEHLNTFKMTLKGWLKKNT